MLERIHNYLNEHVPGRTLQEAQQCLEREADEAKRSMDKLKVQALELGRSALEDSDAEPAVIVHGQSRLVHAGSSVDVERVRQVMELLDDQERMAKLLDATINAEGPLIFIGGEHPFTDTAKCSVIAASYSTGPEVWGTLGVVGPLSMNYAKVIPLVGFSAKLLSDPSQS
jgi:heat-inducible transcriptional repressor